LRPAKTNGSRDTRLHYNQNSQSWWCTPGGNEVKRIRQEYHMFKTSLGYTSKKIRAKQTNWEVCWRCGSSHRMPTLQAQSPEFKPQSHQKKERKEGRKKNRIMLLPAQCLCACIRLLSHHEAVCRGRDLALATVPF
jgi:hypothetical protein